MSGEFMLTKNGVMKYNIKQVRDMVKKKDRKIKIEDMIELCLIKD